MAGRVIRRGAKWGGITGTLSAQTDLQNALNAKAALESPALTGTPTAPTATAGTSTTQVATTAFVQTAVSAKSCFTGISVVDAAWSGTAMVYASLGAVHYNRAQSTGNLILDFRWSSTVGLGAKLAEGESITLTVMITNGNTGYRPTTLRIDGSGAPINRWITQEPKAGTPNTADVYTYTIIKLVGGSYWVIAAHATDGLIRGDAHKRFPALREDFLTSSANALCGFTGVAASSGTMLGATGDRSHPGVVTLRDSGTANGGYAIRTGANASMLLGEGDTGEFIFQSRGARSTAGFRMGFESSFIFQVQPSNAACFEVADQSTQVIRGVCKNDVSATGTDTTYTLTINTWYRGRITVLASANSVLFELFDEAGVCLWSSTVSTNVPNTTGRELGFGVVVGETTTDAAADIMYLDYMSLDINRALTR